VRRLLCGIEKSKGAGGTSTRTKRDAPRAAAAAVGEGRFVNSKTTSIKDRAPREIKESNCMAKKVTLPRNYVCSENDHLSGAVHYRVVITAARQPERKIDSVVNNR